MDRLNSRDKFIPGGFRFYQPETKWRAQSGLSFEQLVQSVMNHRAANRFLAAKHNWALDHDSVANEVDAYNAAICKSHGWNQYIAGGAPQSAVPFPGPSPAPASPGTSLAQSARRVVVGASTIAEMFGPEGPVELPQADSRAAVCAQCEKNGEGDFTRWFTAPAAVALRSMLGFFKGLNLATQHDEKLNICEACYCPLKLKVWAQISHILERMPEADFNELVPQCWIRKERFANAPENQRGEASAQPQAPDHGRLATTV